MRAPNSHFGEGEGKEGSHLSGKQESGEGCGSRRGLGTLREREAVQVGWNWGRVGGVAGGQRSSRGQD